MHRLLGHSLGTIENVKKRNIQRYDAISASCPMHKIHGLYEDLFSILTAAYISFLIVRHERSHSRLARDRLSGVLDHPQQ